MEVKVLLLHLKAEERYGTYSFTDRVIVHTQLHVTARHHLGLRGRIVDNNELERVWKETGVD